MRKIKIIFLGLLLSSLAACGGGGGGGGSDSDGGDSLSNNACGSLGLNRSVRIINGTVCGNLGNSPVVRVISVLSPDTLELCTGTMVTPTVVLTAAHCLTDAVGGGIVIGDAGNVLVVRGVQAFRHPGFRQVSASVFINDVALIRLEAAVNLPTLPILISSSPAAGDKAQIFGYGQDTPAPANAALLRSGEVRISSLNADVITVDFNGDGSKVCHGDSGGPLLSSTAQGAAIIGITSSGSSAGCEEGVASYFTNIQSSDVLSFLNSIAPDISIQ